MSAINIRRDVDDKFYRYKMPSLIVKVETVEGKGNGIKTVIPNMSDIAKALNRPPAFPTKYFGCELGAQVICDDKTNRYIVNGCHEAYRMQEMLDGFISKFVLCPGCKNPETDLVISKDQVIWTKCKACGQQKKIDQTHKLVTFILKTATVIKGKKSRKETDPDASEGDEDFEVGMPSPSEDVQDAVGGPVLLNMINSFEENLIVDSSVGKEDEEEPENDDSVESFAAFVSEKPRSVEELLDTIDDLSLKRYKAVAVYAQVVFGPQILTQLPKQMAILSALCKDVKCQKGLLGGIERLVGVTHPELMVKFPMILKLLYEADVLDEEILLTWADHISKKYVGSKEIAKKLRTAAAPFIDWLKSAESGDSDEE